MLNAVKHLANVSRKVRANERNANSSTNSQPS